MSMEVSTCELITQLPTINDIYYCQQIIQSDEFDWDPSNDLFKIY